MRNRDSSHTLAVESSVVGPPLVEVAGGGFEGTMSELLELLVGKVGDQVARRKEWPKSGQALGAHVKRLAPNLRALGIEVEHAREGNGRRRVVRIERRL